MYLFLFFCFDILSIFVNNYGAKIRLFWHIKRFWVIYECFFCHIMSRYVLSHFFVYLQRVWDANTSITLLKWRNSGEVLEK